MNKIKDKVIKDWTIQEAELLIRLWTKVESIIIISIIMNRTPSSIQTRALRLELPPRNLNEYYRRRWTKKEDDELKKIISQGSVDCFSLSKKKERTIDALLSRALKIGFTINDLSKKIIIPDYIKIYNEGAIIGKGQSKERKCAKCLKPFWSDNFGHRICLSCKSTEDWIDGDL